MDEPAFPGCMLKCRPIGVIEGEQIMKGNKKDRERNDRIIAVEQDAHSWADIKTVGDLGEEFCRELEEFFVNYDKLSREEYKVLALTGRDLRTAFTLGGLAMQVPLDCAAAGDAKWDEDAVHFMFGGLITAIAGVIANAFGPVVGGLFLALAARFPPSATLVERHGRRKA